MVNGAALELQLHANNKYIGLGLSVNVTILSARKVPEIWRGVCSHVDIDDLRLFFEWLFWNIDVGVSLLSGVFRASGQSVSEDSLPKRSSIFSVSLYIVTLTKVVISLTCYN